MRRVGLAAIHSIGLALSTFSTAAVAQDATQFDWRGFYAGLHAGGALGLIDVGDPFGPSIFGDTVRTPGMLAGGQAGYNWQSGSTVLGLEADASWADMDGTNTCFAFSGFYVSSNCRTQHRRARDLDRSPRLGASVRRAHASLRQGRPRLGAEHDRSDRQRRHGLSANERQRDTLRLDTRRRHRARDLGALVAQGRVRFSRLRRGGCRRSGEWVPGCPRRHRDARQHAGYDDGCLAGRASVQGRRELQDRRRCTPLG